MRHLTGPSWMTVRSSTHSRHLKNLPAAMMEIAEIIADGLGRELVIVKTAWDGLVPAVQSGTIDAIIAGMSSHRRKMEDYRFFGSLLQI